jgi:diphthamide synthase (EF-2-diphthine--ammonia ligase)
MCGEGGEYETCVLDCPLFKNKRIVAKTDASTKDLDVEVFEESTPVDPVCHIKFIEGKYKIEVKDLSTQETHE